MAERKIKMYGVISGPVDSEGKERFALFWKGKGAKKYCAQEFRAKRSDHPEVIWVATEDEARLKAWKETPDGTRNRHRREEEQRRKAHTRLLPGAANHQA